jgi:hypothetical protein
VPWNAIRLALADADVPPSECLLAFNASLVGLCIDTADYLSCAPPVPLRLTATHTTIVRLPRLL